MALTKFENYVFVACRSTVYGAFIEAENGVNDQTRNVTYSGNNIIGKRLYFVIFIVLTFSSFKTFKRLHVEMTKCRRAKIFYLPQPGIEPRLLDLQANTLPRRCKSRLLPQGSRSVL